VCELQELPMADIVDAFTRSRMMAGITGKNTRPELQVRRALHAAGYRYRLHDRGLPGRPDLVFATRRAVMFINGCFWHGHDCELFRWPGTRQSWWREKIKATRRRDRRAVRTLLADDWRVLTIWECALKGRQRRPADQVLRQIVRWLEGRKPCHEIRGKVSQRRI
jgi:DNA mismatch endonuclease (patch repair protein)